MKRRFIESSALISAGFDARRQILELQFVDGDIYRYARVPKSVYSALLAATSKGTFFTEQIRGKYTYLKVKKFRKPLPGWVLFDE